jgi:hypothetical protein
MARLVESDYRKSLEVLYAAGEVEGRVAFPEPVLAAIRELVPCDVVTFHERSWRPGNIMAYTGEPISPMTPEIRAAHRRLKHQDPLRPAEAAQTLTDFVSLRDFRRTEFYALVHRPLGIEYMLQLYLDPLAPTHGSSSTVPIPISGSAIAKYSTCLCRTSVSFSERQSAVQPYRAARPGSHRASWRSWCTSPRAGRTTRSADSLVFRPTRSASTSRTRTRSSAPERGRAL